MSAALLLLALQGSALANDCPPYTYYAALPHDGATDVPLNALVVVAFDLRLALDDVGFVARLIEEDSGEEIETEVEIEVEGEQGANWIMDPVADLEPHTTYRLEMDAEGNMWAPTEARFTTGSTVDLIAPPPPTIGRVEQVTREHDDGTGSYTSRTFRIPLSGSSPDEGLRYRVELSSIEDFSDPIVRTSFYGPNASIGSGYCYTDEAASLDPHETWVRVTAIDIAGNESEPDVSEPIPLEPEEGSAPGCSVLDLRQVGGLAILLVLGALGQRRRGRAEAETPIVEEGTIPAGAWPPSRPT